MKFQDCVAFITGAGKGIGKAIGEELAIRGARVILAGRRRQNVERAAEEIQRGGGKAEWVELDVRNQEQVRQVVKQILGVHYHIDILVNNAGITENRLLVRLDLDSWQEVLDINLVGTFICIREVIPLMSKRKYGRIVNISSVVALTGNPGQAHYAAAKAGILGLTRSVAREYAKRRITVNAVAPGFIDTSMTLELSEQAREEILRNIPLGRLGTPKEVAAAVVFLCSEEAGYITGQVFHVNGGLYM
jgi:3-oxoacyl-[acyl-carrier protein] reductase